MAPASLPALVVMRPGPRTASRMNRRRKRRRRTARRVMRRSAGPWELALDRVREDRVERVVDGDEALDLELVVHHWHGQEVVLGEDRRDLLDAIGQVDGDH